MNNSLISIIVPVYNVEKYIHTCINSVMSQTYNNWELILVNDGSPDNSPIICDEYATKDNRIRVIHKKNGGVSSARNAGLDVAQGEYITFLDSDDFWHREYLNILYDLCNKYDADIAQCDFVRGQDTIFPELKVNRSDVKILNNHSVFIEGVAKIILPCKLYRKDLWNDIRMPIGKYFEDDFTTWKLYYKSNIIALNRSPLYFYTQNEHSTMYKHKEKPNLSFLEAYSERIDFFQSNNIKDLEDNSRAHLCKAMILSYTNPNITIEQKKQVLAVFNENWRSIRNSKHVGLNYKTLFWSFSMMPGVIKNMIKTVRR